MNTSGPLLVLSCAGFVKVSKPVIGVRVPNDASWYGEVLVVGCFHQFGLRASDEFVGRMRLEAKTRLRYLVCTVHDKG